MGPTPSSLDKKRFLLCFSSKDTDGKAELVAHLTPGRGALSIWSIDEVPAGGSIRRAFLDAAAEADAALLLLSADFFVEMNAQPLAEQIEQLRQQNTERGLRLIPLLWRDCDWRSVDWLAALQPLPVDGSALRGLGKGHRDRALAEIARQLDNMNLRSGFGPLLSAARRPGSGTDVRDEPMAHGRVTDDVRTSTEMHTGPVVDVLLLCALKDEYDAVRSVTDGLLDPGWVESIGSKGWTVADARFATSTGSPLSIRTTWATQMGREQAQAVASMLIQELPARCLAMSGICAGRRGKVALGDVIFADRLWSYDSGKRVVEGGESHFQGDMFQFRPPSTWVQRMQQVSVPQAAPWLARRPLLPLEHQEDWILLRILAGEDPSASAEFALACPDWSAALPRLWERQWLEKPTTLTDVGRARANELKLLHPRGLPAPPAFQVHVAPVATGAEVTEDEGIFPRLAISMRKVLGVEMEASALGALGDLHGAPVIVAKAVSDYGDRFKDDRYRHFAARAAAECLISLLCRAVDLLPGRNAEAAPLPSRRLTDLPDDLIRTLADEYPDVRDARAVWERAGGKASEVENIYRPRDLWQRLWTRSMQGAAVRPAALLREALRDLPGNPVLIHYLNKLEPYSLPSGGQSENRNG